MTARLHGEMILTSSLTAQPLPIKSGFRAQSREENRAAGDRSFYRSENLKTTFHRSRADECGRRRAACESRRLPARPCKALGESDRQSASRARNARPFRPSGETRSRRSGKDSRARVKKRASAKNKSRSACVQRTILMKGRGARGTDLPFAQSQPARRY